MTEENERNDDATLGVNRRNVMKAAAGGTVGLVGLAAVNPGSAGNAGVQACTCDNTCDTTATTGRLNAPNHLGTVSTECGTAQVVEGSQGCIQITSTTGCLQEVRVKGGSGTGNTGEQGTNVYTAPIPLNTDLCTPINPSGENAEVSNVEYIFCCDEASASVLDAQCESVTVRVCDVCAGSSATVTVAYVDCDGNTDSESFTVTDGDNDRCIEETLTLGSLQEPTNVTVTYDGNTLLNQSVTADPACVCPTPTPTPTATPVATPEPTPEPDDGRAISWIAFCGCDNFSINCVTLDEDGEVASVDYDAGDCDVLFMAGGTIFHGDGSVASTNPSDSRDPCGRIHGTSGTKIEAEELINQYPTC